LPDRFSTRISYLSLVNTHIRPKWADFPLDKIKPMAVEDWLRQFAVGTEIQGQHTQSNAFDLQVRRAVGVDQDGEEPHSLGALRTVPSASRRPRVLAAAEFCGLLPDLKHPYRTMVIVAQCLGLQVSEIVALKWRDFDFQNLTLLVQRSIVHGRLGAVKTE
jgi:integrase